MTQTRGGGSRKVPGQGAASLGAAACQDPAQEESRGNLGNPSPALSPWAQWMWHITQHESGQGQTRLTKTLCCSTVSVVRGSQSTSQTLWSEPSIGLGIPIIIPWELKCWGPGVGDDTQSQTKCSFSGKSSEGGIREENDLRTPVSAEMPLPHPPTHSTQSELREHMVASRA